MDLQTGEGSERRVSSIDLQGKGHVTGAEVPVNSFSIAFKVYNTTVFIKTRTAKSCETSWCVSLFFHYSLSLMESQALSFPLLPVYAKLSTSPYEFFLGLHSWWSSD